MTPKQWKEKYIQELMDRTLLSRKEAINIYEAGINDHDFESNPLDAVLDELSYWGEG